MSVNNTEDFQHDHKQPGDFNNGQSDSFSRDDAGVASGERSELSGLENPGPLGSELTGGSEEAGSSGLSDSLPLSQPATGGRTGSHSEESGYQPRGTRGAGNEWYKHAGARNFLITDDLDIGKGGAKAKYQDNIAAIKLVKTGVGEDGYANDDQQKILARYVGWGGLPQVFDPDNASWAEQYSELKELLTEDEYQLARGSTLNAHYTSLDVIDGIYAGLDRLGLKQEEGKKLHILEPAAGIGNFLGRAPEHFRSASFTQIELDKLTSAINANLYPDSRVLNTGFEKFRSKAGYFDAAIGNPPFGNYKVYDPSFTALSKHTIHNYFIGKSLASVHPGGVVGMVVSRYFLDSVNPNARIDIAKMGHFLGAVRLPNTAFKENALTSVSTDIVFFKRAAPGEEPDMSWTQTVKLKERSTGQEMDVNHYYLDHPEQIIGKMATRSSQYGPVVDCLPPDNLNIREAILERINALPKGVYTPADPFTASVQAEEKLKIPVPENLTVGSFFVTPDERIARRLPDLMDEFDYEYVETRSEKDVERIVSALAIRDTVKALIKLESSADGDEEEMENLRAELNKLYDRHVKKYDFLNSRSNRGALKDEPSFPLLLSLETDYDKGITKTVALRDGVEQRKPSAKKVSIFERRVTQPQRKITSAENAKDALVISLNEYGRVDLDHMSRLTAFSAEKLQMDLKGHIFFDPESEAWVVADKYLTGNVKDKLQKAEHAGLIDNIEALQAVQPADIDAVDISVQLGSVWVPGKDIQQFIREELEIGTASCSVNYLPALGYWIAKVDGGNSVALKTTWGTERYPADDLVEAILKNTPIKVEDIVGTDERGNTIKRVNEAETTAAQGKAEEIQNRFKDWIWKDPDRRERLARLYNDKFNTHVAPHYNGGHLTLPTASSVIALRAHQKNAIWRGTQEGGGLFDHVVGAGKTLVAIGTVMESRRMGLLKKPLVVVPNHLLNQWKEEFYKLYPSANILVATKDDFSKENRQRLFSHIATGDWDAVIVAHSSFKYIGMPEEVVEKFVNQQLRDLEDAISHAKSENGDRLSIKELEKQRKRLQSKIEKSSEEVGRKDSAITFDMLGIDGLVVDEAHEFKNLKITTKMTRVAGLGNLEGSEKAMDLFMKCRYLQEKNDGRGVFFLTGTPISNTIAELYTMQRYLQYEELQSKDVLTFDAWASTFGQIETGWELDATGVNYRLNTRFSKFTNVPELISMYRSFSDVVTQQDLAEQAIRDGSGRLVPKVAGGKPKNVIVERSDDLSRYMGVQEQVLNPITNEPAFDGSGMKITQWNEGSIIYRMENLPEDRSIDNALKVTNDARLAALDYRLKDGDAEDFEGSKVNVAVENIYRIWAEETYRSGTQLVFCDLSTPKGQKTAPAAAARVKSDDEEADTQDKDSPVISMDELLAGSTKFSVYDDIRAKLIAKGVPPEEIRFIHEASNDNKKADLFRDMNAGRARILLGSTQKMGAGTNVQRKLVALHHLDAPWRPSDLEQREGRIIRQGNEFFEQDKNGFEVQIYRYSTKQTYDARMWQTIESKAVGIEQFRRGSLTDRVIDDVVGEAANAAEMKAAATGNELIFKQVKINAERKKQESLYNNFQRSSHQLERRINNIPQYIQTEENERQNWLQVIDTVNQFKDVDTLDTGVTQFFTRAVSKNSYVNKENATLISRYISAALKKAVDNDKNGIRDDVVIGKYKGLDITVRSWPNLNGRQVDFNLYHDGELVRFSNYTRGSLSYDANSEFSVSGFFTRVNNILSSFVGVVPYIDDKIEQYKNELSQAHEQLSKEYSDKPYLDALRQDAIDVMRELKLMQDDSSYKSEWVPLSETVERKAQVIEPHVDIQSPVQKVVSHSDLSSDIIEQFGQIEGEAMSNVLADSTLVLEENPDLSALREIQREQNLDLREKVVLQEAANSPEPEQSLLTLGLPEEKVREVLEHKEELTPAVEEVISNAQSHQLLQQLEGESNPPAPAAEHQTFDFSLGRVVYNTDIERLQIFFNDKPLEDTPAHDLKEKLKVEGKFFVSKKNGWAWQRKLNDLSIAKAAKLLEIELPKIGLDTGANLDPADEVGKAARTKGRKDSASKNTENGAGNSDNPSTAVVPDSSKELKTLNRYLLNTLSAESMFKLSETFTDDDGHANAAFWLEESAKRHHHPAIWAMVKQATERDNLEEMTRWNQVGSEAGIPELAYAQAQQYHYGSGVEQSFIRAMELYSTAAGMGSQEARGKKLDQELIYHVRIEEGDTSAWLELANYHHERSEFGEAIDAYLKVPDESGHALHSAAQAYLSNWHLFAEDRCANRASELLVDSLLKGYSEAEISLRSLEEHFPSEALTLAVDKLREAGHPLAEELYQLWAEPVEPVDSTRHPLEVARDLSNYLDGELNSEISFDVPIPDEDALIKERDDLYGEIRILRAQINDQYPEFEAASNAVSSIDREVEWWKREHEFDAAAAIESVTYHKGFITPEGKELSFSVPEDKQAIHSQVMNCIREGIQEAHKSGESVVAVGRFKARDIYVICTPESLKFSFEGVNLNGFTPEALNYTKGSKITFRLNELEDELNKFIDGLGDRLRSLQDEQIILQQKLDTIGGDREALTRRFDSLIARSDEISSVLSNVSTAKPDVPDTPEEKPVQATSPASAPPKRAAAPAPKM